VDGFRDQATHLQRALPVDFQQHVVAMGNLSESQVADVAYQWPWTKACSRNSPLAFKARKRGSSMK
jgi:hypothetical protein